MVINDIKYAQFRDNQTLKQIIISNQVPHIPDSAFSRCRNLQNVIIENGVKSIGELTFSHCSSLVSIVFPNSLEIIGKRSFIECSSLSSIEIPSSVTYIKYEAFSGCYNLNKIIVDKNNADYYSIGNCLFRKSDNELILGCNNSVIPYGADSIGNDAFVGYKYLTSIYIPETVTGIGTYAFLGCPNLIIKCQLGSYAQRYAIKNNIPYICNQ